MVVARDVLLVNGRRLDPGDGIAVAGVQGLRVLAEEDAEFILFDT